MSNEALHNSFELANSKFVEPLSFFEFNLKPLPSSKFFLTRSFGSGDTFLASPAFGKPPHEFKKSKGIKKRAQQNIHDTRLARFINSVMYGNNV